MEGKDLFRKLFEYDRWGNQQALASLSTVGEAVERPRKIFCHVLGAQQLWLSRFEAPQHPDVDPWPLLPLPACRAAVEELHQGWTALLDRLTAEQLAGDLVYRNTKGVEFKTPIQDVLMQLVMHSAYHRGQVAAAVREAGGKPSPTDYVVWVRQSAAAAKS